MTGVFETIVGMMKYTTARFVDANKTMFMVSSERSQHMMVVVEPFQMDLRKKLILVLQSKIINIGTKKELLFIVMAPADTLQTG